MNNKKTFSESQKQTKPKKKNNIMNYAVIMIICVIIVILIAAMADDREEQIDNRIMETERANANIQNELVNLKDENYKLSKELEKTKESADSLLNSKSQLDSLTNVWNLYESGKMQEAAAALQAIDNSAFDENLTAYYNALSKLFDIK